MVFGLATDVTISSGFNTSYRRKTSGEAMITVIIPVYNRPKELHRALQSLAEQTVKDFEVVVCDDGSEEDVESVVNSFMSRLDLRYWRAR
jgi:glycosyltransferase involved in cell wall biosynthesis